jgi:hypothetical protein
VPPAAAPTEAPSAPQSQHDLGCELAPGVWAVLYPKSRLSPLQEAYRAGGGPGSIADLGALVLLLRETGRELTGAWASLAGLRLQSARTSWEMTVVFAVDWELASKPGVALLQLSPLPVAEVAGEVADSSLLITAVPAWSRALEEGEPSAAVSGPA